MFTMCNAALTHVEILRLRDATELNNGGMIKLGDRHPLPNRTEFITARQHSLLCRALY